MAGLRTGTAAVRATALACCLALASAGGDSGKPAPGRLQTSELADHDALPEARRRLVATALEAAGDLKLSRYLYGSADPARGGFDCSGAMFFLLGRFGLKPPRSSAAQYEWVKAAGNLRVVPEGVASLDDPAFAALRPGDLIFWSGTYDAASGRPNPVTHVQMFLGREIGDGRPVMIGSSDGRTYRGTGRCGFGVFDLVLPGAGSKARLVGYGPPPGIGDDR